MDQKIDKEVLSFKRNASISILEVLSEFIMSEIVAVFRPVTESLLNILLCFISLLTKTSHMRMFIRRQMG